MGGRFTGTTRAAAWNPVTPTFQDLAAHVAQLVWTAGPDGTLAYVNRDWAGPAGPGLRRALATALHPDDAGPLLAAWNEAVATGQPFRAEARLRDGPGASLRLHLCRADPVRARPDGPVLHWIGSATDVEDARRAEARRARMRDELNHRVKNTLAIVQSMATQSFRGIAARDPGAGADVALARASFEGRLFALARVHDVVAREAWDGAAIAEVVLAGIGPCRDAHLDRFAASGPSVRLAPALSVGLALALHELCTNAVRHGALSEPFGRVALAWNITGRGGARRLEILWTERDGPRLAGPPPRRGFGTRLVERSLSDDGDSTVTLRFEPVGLTCTFDLALPEAANQGG